MLAVCASIVRLEFHIGVVAHGFFIMINIVALIRRPSQSVSSSLLPPTPLPLPHLLLISLVRKFPQAAAAAAVVAPNEMTPREDEEDWGKMLMNCQGIGMN